MKTDVLIVPNDTLVLGVSNGALGEEAVALTARFSPSMFLEILRDAYAAAYCAEGWHAYQAGCFSCPSHGKCDAEAVAGPRSALPSESSMRVASQLLVMGVGDRLEPLYPVPDDVLVEPGPRDAVWAQPTYLETIAQDLVQHDMGERRLLAPSSRNLRAHDFDAYLTRKGVRVWSERKPQRLSEGEHYLPFRRLFDIESRPVQGADALGVPLCETHLRLRPGFGFLITVETPDNRPAFALPVTVAAVAGNRTLRVEHATFPQPTIDLKPRKRWRLCLLSTMFVEKGQWPPFLDGATLATRAPLPEGGKVVAFARRQSEHELDGSVSPRSSGAGQAFIPVGTTFFIEFEEPVRIEQSAEILAGGS
ncbi:MAG: hypothetical protein MUF54_07270 [Polyangiaceae bacterium]|jgi:hypothetical protein|nr:hypothetical protein [Polyangiaceae bacterium]